MSEPVRWESIDCPVCSSKNHTHWRTVHDRFETIPGRTYSIVSCDDCGCRFLTPRPPAESIHLFYEHAEYDPFLSTKRKLSWQDALYAAVRRYAVWRKRLLLERFRREGRLLDVGCGTGEFLHYLQRFQWEVTGVEPETGSRSFARERGLRVVPGLESLPAVQYHVITMWHVLEHLHDLAGGLEQIIDHLADRGVFILAMPNVDSWDMKRYQEDWIALDTPRHLYHFTEKDVRKLIPASRLQLVDTGSLWLDTLYNVLYSEQLHHRRTHRRYRPWYMLKTVMGSFLHDWQSPVRRASASVYIFRKENRHA